MPLIYTGQETAMDRALEFFVKDTPPQCEPVQREVCSSIFLSYLLEVSTWNCPGAKEVIIEAGCASEHRYD